jgi:hypothetical protein
MVQRQNLFVLMLLVSIAVISLTACSNGSDEVETDPTSAGSQQSTPTVDADKSTSVPNPTERPADTQTPDSPTSTAQPADPNDDRPTATPTQGIAVGEPVPGFSPIELPKRKITFSVSVPENTPDGEPIFLTIVNISGGEHDRVRMKNLGAGEWEATADVSDNAMVRYTYDRFEFIDDCCLQAETRESLGESFRMQYRFLMAEPGLDRVNDTVPMWIDLQKPYVEGQVTGFVVDSKSGEPILDADVSISGVHVGTRVDGTFKVPRLPAGEHTVVVHSNTGDFNPVQKIVTLAEGGAAEVGFAVSSTHLVPVSFDVLLPDTTPDTAWVKLAGNIYSLGGRIEHPARPNSPSNFFIPRLERDGDHASGDFMLPAGAFIEYFYTIGPIGVAQETAEQGRQVYRSFVVGDEGDRRSDSVQNWWNEGWPLATLRLFPPIGTPPGTPIALNMGPASWMEPDEDGSYTTVVGGSPGGTVNYRYILGDAFHAEDGSDEAIDGQRSFVMPEGGGEVVDVITNWASQRDPSARREDGSLAVKLRLSVPPETPIDSQIFLVGDRPALGDGVELTQMAGNPWMYAGEVVFGHDGTLNFSYELRSEGIESFARRIETDYDGQVVNDWVTQWPGLASSVEERDGFIKGYYTPDFFGYTMIPLSDSTYKNIREHEGSAVVVSSVWSYGQTQPIPTLEYRGVHAGTVSTPLEEAIIQAQKAHDAGLDVFWGPQFNMEQAPGGFETYNGPKSDEWWIEWMKLADEMWTWQATVGEMIEAEYMMLPGPLFHVYDWIDRPDDHATVLHIESEHKRIIEKVRSIYSGKIVITGSADRYVFPGTADFNGVTTYDVGVPKLPADTTVAEFVDYYEGRFVERVDPIGDRWGNPVFFYTIHAPSVATESDPSGEISQANALEALFQVIATRPEIVAGLSWSYEMIDIPLHPGDGVRGRLAEAVLAKWYAILGGSN